MLALLLSLALAAPPPDDGGELTDEETATIDEHVEPERIFGEARGEIIVTDVREVDRARAAMVSQLEDMGYHEGRRRGSWTIYNHDVAWKPRVLVHEDGWMLLKRQPPRVAAPEIPGAWWNDVPVVEWMPCIVVPTACVRAGGWTISPRKFARQKELVVEATEDELIHLGDALAANALFVRINEELPEQLESIWYQGLDPQRPDQPLATFAERRAALLTLWSSRTDTPYGDAVREAIEAFMLFEVQPSDHPFTAEEIERTNRERTCARALELPAEVPW